MRTKPIRTTIKTNQISLVWLGLDMLCIFKFLFHLIFYAVAPKNNPNYIYMTGWVSLIYYMEYL